MKKAVLSFAIGLIATLSASAQELVITLTHGEQNTSYYGVDAFKKAMDAAANGDLITLSPGIFHGSTINKSVTIRGNGVDGDGATIIDTDTDINKVAIENDPGLNIQGINFTAGLHFYYRYDTENVVISKCDMAKFYCEYKYSGFPYYGCARNINVINCRIKEQMLVRNNSDFNFVNCLLCNMAYENYSDSHHVSYENCVILFTDKNQIFSTDKKLNFAARNSIIITDGTTESFQNAPNLDHCIVTGTAGEMPNLFDKCVAVDCQYLPVTSVFKTMTDITKYVDDTYELTDSVAAIAGTNGTQLGIYGGYLPYNSTVSYPQFSTFNVAEKAEAGKLNVDIKVVNE